MSTVLSTEVTTAIRDFGTQRRAALGSTMIRLAASAGVSESSRARIAREVVVPPAQFLAWIAGALESSAMPADAGSRRSGPVVDHPRADFVIVDKSLTRC